MNLGVSMWSYVTAARNGMTVVDFIHEAKRLGVDGVELLDFFWKDIDAELPAVDAALRETGLTVGVYSVGNNFVIDDESERNKNVQIIKDGVDMAVHFGAKVVRVFAGDLRPSVSYETALGWIITGLKDAAAYASDNGVTLALENHGKLAGMSGQVETIVNAVASPALKANPDTGNFLLVHQASHEAVAALAPRAAMVHFKDFHAVPDDYAGFTYTALDGLKFAGTAIGEGDVDLEDCVAALRQAGFDGWLNIEYEGSEDPMTALPRSVAYTRSLLG